MSLILDALRKSEAERRRGQAPDLYAELPPLVTRPVMRRPAWPWWLAGSLAVLATLWWVRDLRSTAGVVAVSDAPAPQASSQPLEAASAPTSAVTSASARTASLEPAAAATAPVRPIPAALPPPSEPTAATKAATRVADTAVLAPAVPSPLPGRASQERASPQPAPPQLSLPPPPPSSQPVAVAPPAPAPVSAGAAPAPMRLADLPVGEREQLPALKISMHMWGPTPAQRFAIIDGARVGQGDRVGDAVVEEIAADSVILNWHGERVALPIR
ncbi:general secretion pathway protein GspB [Lysobacter sp. TAF61]|uniref:general secretion pathway protein GspB n=1 Tax=Lysobacter sp. TAF61 TaxID=3233072 RepID=UPI003F94933D